MPHLSFQIDGAEPDLFAAVPMLLFHVRIGNSIADEPIQNIALRCQIRIESTRRRYTASEQAKLVDLFGEPERWSSTLGSMLWTHTTAVVPSFENQIIIDLPAPCTFDFNVAATKYFAGLDDGEIPLELQFSGTLFYHGKDHNLKIAQIPWDQDVRFRLPVDCWRQMMAHYYPNGAWLRLRRDVFDRLMEYKSANGIAHWEVVFDRLLAASNDEAPA
jgi:hypothetical protein